MPPKRKTPSKKSPKSKKKVEEEDSAEEQSEEETPKKNGKASKSKASESDEESVLSTPKPSKSKNVDASDDENFKTPSKKIAKGTPATKDRKRKSDDEVDAPSTPLSSKKTPKKPKSDTPLSLFGSLLSKQDLKAIPAFSPKQVRAVDTHDETKEHAWNPDKAAPMLDVERDKPNVVRHNGIENEVGLVQSTVPLDRKAKKVAYFEVKVHSAGHFAIGLSPEVCNLTKPLGSQPDSTGFHSTDSVISGGVLTAMAFGATFGDGDVVGCGILTKTGQIFFTMNGHYLGVVAQVRLGSTYSLFPTVQLTNGGQSATLLTSKFMFALKKKHLKSKSPVKAKARASLTDEEMGLYSNGIPLPLPSISGKVTIVNYMAEVEITQDYINYTSTPLDASFTFPLPHESLLSNFQVSFPDATIVGQVQASHGATKGSKELKETTQLASSNILQAEITNIQPNHKVSITVAYIVQLTGEANQMKLRIPSGCFPFHALRWDSSVYDLDAQGFTFREQRQGVTLNVSVSAGLPITAIRSNAPNGPFEVAYNEREYGPTISYAFPAIQSDFQMSVLLHNAHFPQAVVEFDEQAWLALVAFIPFTPICVMDKEEFIFLVETTDESMISVIRDALHVALRGLLSENQFQIITYANSPKTMFDLQPLTADTLRAADEQIDQIQASKGHADLDKALMSVLEDLPEKETDADINNRPRNVFVLFGEASVPKDADSLVESVQSLCAKDKNQHVFPVAFGQISDLAFVHSLGRAGQGAVELVLDTGSLTAKVLRQLERAQRGALYDIGFDYGVSLSSQQPEGANITEIVPHPIYSLFSADLLVAFCNLEGFSDDGALTINAHAPKLMKIEQGTKKDDEDLDAAERWQTSLNLTERKGPPIIQRFKAAKKLKLLEEAEDDNDSIKQCIKLAEEYKLLSKYTSIIPVDASEVKKKRLQRSVNAEVKYTIPQEATDTADTIVALIKLQSSDGSWEKTKELAKIMQVKWEKLEEYSPKSLTNRDKEETPKKSKKNSKKEAKVSFEDTDRVWATALVTEYTRDYILPRQYQAYKLPFRKGHEYLAQHAKTIASSVTREALEFLHKETEAKTIADVARGV